MGRLDDYRTALLVADPAVSDAALVRALDSAGPDFDIFVVDHGLGPLWHERTGRSEFHQSRMAAEALHMAQERALKEVDSVMCERDIDYAVIKGAANRLSLYDKPALRACHDIDLLVRPDDRVEAASALVVTGFCAIPESRSISRELVLSRSDADIDLHWRLLRDGRLRTERVPEMLAGRERTHDLWMLNAEDSLFLLLVHPAFAKHLAGWEMGLHRVVDIVACLRMGQFDWQAVLEQLRQNGVAAAAWATLRWTEMLTEPQSLPGLHKMMSDLAPGIARRRWIELWLRRNLSARLSRANWMRLAGLSLFLHDAPGDAARAFSARYKARRRQEDDLAVFSELIG
jgi:hypothetical protein